jgi:hypothetical protein
VLSIHKSVALAVKFVNPEAPGFIEIEATGLRVVLFIRWIILVKFDVCINV